jgi:putative membrane protein
MMMIYDHDLGAWGWMWMSASMLVFWALLIGAVVLAVRALNRPPTESTPPRRATESAEQVLAERFAHGEIDTEEYRERLHTLHSATAP